MYTGTPVPIFQMYTHTYIPGYTGEVDEHFYDSLLSDVLQHSFIDAVGLSQLQDRTAIVISTTCDHTTTHTPSMVQSNTNTDQVYSTVIVG